MLCWFLPYINTDQPQVYIGPLPLEPPPSHPTPPLWISQSPSLSSPGLLTVPCIDRCFVSLFLLFLLLIPSLVLLLSEVFDC